MRYHVSWRRNPVQYHECNATSQRISDAGLSWKESHTVSAGSGYVFGLRVPTRLRCPSEAIWHTPVPFHCKSAVHDLFFQFFAQHNSATRSYLLRTESKTSSSPFCAYYLIS